MWVEIVIMAWYFVEGSISAHKRGFVAERWMDTIQGTAFNIIKQVRVPERDQAEAGKTISFVPLLCAASRTSPSGNSTLVNNLIS